MKRIHGKHPLEELRKTPTELALRRARVILAARRKQRKHDVQMHICMVLALAQVLAHAVFGIAVWPAFVFLVIAHYYNFTSPAISGRL